MTYVDGADFSKYQYLWNETTGEMLAAMNFNRAAEAGLEFLCGRVTLGILTDYAYDYRNIYCSLIEAQRTGVPTSGYHAMRPYHTSLAQMDAFFRALDKYSFQEDFPFWFDCERPDNQTRYIQTKRLVECIEIFYARRRYYPDIYTNIGYWNSNILPDPIFNQCNLVVANYTTGPAPLIPFSWADRYPYRWRIWQHSADGNGMGAFYGAPSHSIDLDRCYNRTVYENMLFGNPPATPPPIGEYPMTLFKTLVANQAVRTEPTTIHGQATIKTRLPLSTTVGPVHEIVINNPNEVWFLIEQGWLAAVHGGTQYLEEIRT